MNEKDQFEKASWSPTVDVFIDVYFTKIFNIDLVNQRFHAEAIIESKWFDPNIKTFCDSIDEQKLWKPDLYIENSIEYIKEEISYRVLPSNTSKYFNNEGVLAQSSLLVCEIRKINGSFYDNFELKNYPLDVQDLSISVTTKKPGSTVNFVAINNKKKMLSLNNTLNKNLWNVHHVLYTSKYEILREYSFGYCQYPVIRVSMKVFHQPSSFYWNVLVPILLVTLASLVSFAIGNELPQYRLPVTCVIMLTSVCIRWSLNSSITMPSSLTSLDKYFLASLFIITLELLYHAIMGTIAPSIGKYIASKIDFGFFLLFFIIIIFKQILFIVWVFSIQMIRKNFLNSEEVRLNEEYGGEDEEDESTMESQSSTKRDYDIKRINQVFNYYKNWETMKPNSNGKNIKPSTINWVQGMNSDYYTVTV